MLMLEKARSNHLYCCIKFLKNCRVILGYAGWDPKPHFCLWNVLLFALGLGGEQSSRVIMAFILKYCFISGKALNHDDKITLRGLHQQILKPMQKCVGQDSPLYQQNIRKKPCQSIECCNLWKQIRRLGGFSLISSSLTDIMLSYTWWVFC